MNSPHSDSDLFELLRHNQGFDNPSEWLTYAQLHQFRKVKATKRTRCPDCGGTSFHILGEYIYYSQLMKIRACNSCDLLFSDVLLDRSVRVEHFEAAYKDEEYFIKSRGSVFAQIINLLLKMAPGHKSIIDVGGAKGHLAKSLMDRNTAYDVSVSDLSKSACDYAASHFGLKTVCCSVEELYQHGRRYDVILLIDVLYFAEDVRLAWTSLNGSLKANGLLMIRLPNKIWRMKWVHLLSAVRIKGKEKRKGHISGVNPEHIYFFTRRYLLQKLKALGFSKIEFRPSRISKPLDRPVLNLSLGLYYPLAVAVYYLTFKRVILTPSQLVVAKK